jgi:Rod binding domain-containing protein
MTGYASLGALSGVLPADFNVNVNTMGNNETTRIKQVSKAMETLFANQLSEELGKEIQSSDSTDNTDDPGSGGNVYGDFIQQALSQGLTSGKGLGLAQQIEQYLTRREHPDAAPYMHPPLQHVKSAH